MKPNDMENQSIDVFVLENPFWVTIFFAFAIPVSFIFLIVGLILGFSVSNDRVFATYALLSGVVSLTCIKGFLRRKLFIWINPKVPLAWVWYVICCYVFFAQPLSNA